MLSRVLRRSRVLKQSARTICGRGSSRLMLNPVEASRVQRSVDVKFFSGVAGGGGGGGVGVGGGGGGVVDVQTPEEFQSLLSSPSAVVFQFTATWCGPCKTLGPKLERAVAAKGGMTLARVDVDKVPAVAQALRIQSVPTILGVRGGKMLDSFQGDVPESRIEELLGAVESGEPNKPKSPIEQASEVVLSTLSNATGRREVAEVGWLSKVEDDTARNQLEQGASELGAVVERGVGGGVEKLTDEQRLEVAVAGALRIVCLLGTEEDAEKALETVEKDAERCAALWDEFSDNEAIQVARTSIAKTKSSLAASSTLGPIQEAAASNPDDATAQLALATALQEAGRLEEAADIGVATLHLDKAAARTWLLGFFEDNEGHPIVTKARKDMSRVLF